MTHSQLHALNRRKKYERKRNINRNLAAFAKSMLARGHAHIVQKLGREAFELRNNYEILNTSAHVPWYRQAHSFSKNRYRPLSIVERRPGWFQTAKV